MPALPVKPEYGPTLSRLVAARSPRAARALPWVAGALALTIGLAVLVARTGGEQHVVVSGPHAAFNLRHPDALERRGEAGSLLHLEQRRADGLFLQSFDVRPLVLPAYRGEASGVLPVLAERLRRRLEARIPGFELVEEGRARINQVPGYSIAYKGRTDEGRRLYGRRFLMVPEVPGARRGVEIVLRATPASGVPGAEQLGSVGSLKLPLRSFRFGTEAA